MVKMDYEKLLKTERLLFLLDKEEQRMNKSERLLLCQMGFRGIDFAQIQKLALVFSTPRRVKKNKSLRSRKTIFRIYQRKPCSRNAF